MVYDRDPLREAHVHMLKRAMDIVLSLLGLIVLSPLIAAAAIAILLTMGRPVLFRDHRSGKDGVPFVLLKFRTMRPLGPGERSPDDDAKRVTRLGTLMRSSSIDELPSLVNILRGEMSLVGPRPLPTHYLERYSPTQRRRLEVRPGLTGLAQVEGRNDIDWDERLALDVEYVESRTLGLDVRLIARTFGPVFQRTGINPQGQDSMHEFRGEAGRE